MKITSNSVHIVYESNNQAINNRVLQIYMKLYKISPQLYQHYIYLNSFSDYQIVCFQNKDSYASY